MTRDDYLQSIGRRVPTRETKPKTKRGWHACPTCNNPTRGGESADPRCAKCQTPSA